MVKGFLEKSRIFSMMAEDHTYDETSDDSIITATKGGGGVADETLLKMLKDLRKSNAKKIGVPPFVIFQDPSLEDMALKYPISLEELAKCSWCWRRQSKKNMVQDFVGLISQYVSDNDIVRQTIWL